MLDVGLRIVAALFALGLMRSGLYAKYWGHGARFRTFLYVGLGVALVTPLWNGVPASRPWLLVAAVPALFPWRALYNRLLERSTRRGVAALAETWGGDVVEEAETGLFTAERPGNGRREAWVGNVLTEIRSLHPAVSTTETHRMLAFVVRLEAEPPVRCALTRGLERPRYHDREWRMDFAAQGQVLGMSLGDLLTEGFRETGGSRDELVSMLEPGDVLGPYQTVLVSDPDAFDDVFSGPVLDALLEAGSRSPAFELNVTPTSVNILTPYCGEEEQRARLGLVDLVAERLLESRKA